MTHLTINTSFPLRTLTILLAYLCLSLVACNTEQKEVSTATKTSHFTASVSLQHVRTIAPAFSPESMLTWPRRVRRDSQGNFIWVEDTPPAYVFDEQGRFVRTFGLPGEGPGELGSAVDFDFDSEGNIHIFDLNNRQVSIFDANYQFLYSYLLETDNLKQIAIDKHGNLFRLREAQYNGAQPAVVKHDNKGTELAAWGAIPVSARVQSNLVGGGIRVDAEDHVYYGYISDHRIWKTDATGTTLNILDAQPAYYQGPDAQILENTEKTTDLMRYFLGLSRIEALLLAPNNLILQQIATKRDDGMDHNLEVWHSDGFKIASGIETPGLLLFADENALYFAQSVDEEQKNPQILVYEYHVEPQKTLAAH